MVSIGRREQDKRTRGQRRQGSCSTAAPFVSVVPQIVVRRRVQVSVGASLMIVDEDADIRLVAHDTHGAHHRYWRMIFKKETETRIG